MIAPVSSSPTDSLVPAPSWGGLWPNQPGRDRGTGRVPAGGAVRGSGPAAAMRRAALRALAVAALALAGLLVFGLLPGGRDAAAVVPGQHLLPAAPTVHSLHPHGPNRPLRHS
jgi:hypothetical protein